MPAEQHHSDSSRALFKILEPAGAPGKLEKAAEALGQKLHRTELWRYSTGRVTPAADRAALLETITDGEVAANGWTADADKQTGEAPTDPAPAATGTETR